MSQFNIGSKTMKLVIEEASRLLQIVAKHYFDEIERPPSRLYHYTSLDTLATMLEAGLAKPDSFCFGTWFAGSCLTQNDRAEFGIAGGAFLSHLRTHSNESYNRIPKLVDQYLDNLGPFVMNTVSETYAICFSKKADDLQQWLIYGDLGAGVCLEINADLLWDVSVEQKWSFSDVLYGEHEICGDLEPFLSDCTETLAGTYYIKDEKQFEPLLPLAVFIAFFSLVGAKSKSASFCQESEWRLFSQSWGETLTESLKCRRKVMNRNGYLRHGVIVDLHAKKSLVTKIILGPRCTNPSTMQTVGTLLMGFKKCHNITVEQSEVPYAG